jgi:hypothetical protein
MKIGNIGNYYGDLQVRVDQGKFYWGIDNYDGVDWEEITEELYCALIKFNTKGIPKCDHIWWNFSDSDLLTCRLCGVVKPEE